MTSTAVGSRARAPTTAPDSTSWISSVYTVVRVGRTRTRLAAQCKVPPTPRETDKLPMYHDAVGDVNGQHAFVVHGGLQGGIGGGPATFKLQQDGHDMDGTPNPLAKFRVEYVERPGFGRSPSRGVEDMLRDSAWIADHLFSESDPKHLMGHS